MSIFLETLIESYGSETESPRMADFRLVSSRRKETRGIDLNTDGRTMKVLLAPVVTSNDRSASTIYTESLESLRPPQIHSHYKRIIPSLTSIPFIPLLNLY